MHGVAEGQMPFSSAWDAQAETFELTAGDMVTWPQNMPHRVDNGPMMNVSVSMEFMTPPARMRANVLHANGVLRAALGWTPAMQDRLGPGHGRQARGRQPRTRPGPIARKPQPVLPETFAVETRTA